MYTTYHLDSAQEISTEIIDAIKVAFQSKAIKITIEEEMDETDYLLSTEANKIVLIQSIKEDQEGNYVNINIPK
jgi:hypothetical protein